MKHHTYHRRRSRSQHWPNRRIDRARRRRTQQRLQTLRMLTSLVAVKILVAPIISDVIGNYVYDGLGTLIRWLQH
ncbi:hypothetical protein [Herpetosiphon llansteffanensis]|uniref:hypothetical protein n=1 Tax=Herpetosiphon llansteffanensis TaxID=2094568 RepID=UPI000D7C4DEF|nr:hypothetical protein [Herpetosiphon llansteffanensis]